MNSYIERKRNYLFIEENIQSLYPIINTIFYSLLPEKYYKKEYGNRGEYNYISFTIPYHEIVEGSIRIASITRDTDYIRLLELMKDLPDRLDILSYIKYYLLESKGIEGYRKLKEIEEQLQSKFRLNEDKRTTITCYQGSEDEASIFRNKIINSHPYAYTNNENNIGMKINIRIR